MVEIEYGIGFSKNFRPILPGAVNKGRLLVMTTTTSWKVKSVRAQC